ncbi:fumarate hydratase [Roseospirillum parvum]|uniref:Fumarate hydratase class I n=1 Tax=Roseospirillum parvum TaxID=83401 RepID=A0A1G7WUB7_9PROT|nr:fumarate hydratase [Roseospirillum parvum]SDG75523.1 fumarate hydratase, class I [Roseospirillum parvum]
MIDPRFAEMFPLADDGTPYRRLSGDYVHTERLGGHQVLLVEPEGLKRLAFEAMRDSAHLLRPAHLAQLRAIFDDPEASDNDRFVALSLLRNANISAGMVLPMCQDTGTAIVMGKKGQRVWTENAAGITDAQALSAGIAEAYQTLNLRYSQMSPKDMWEEVNTGNNLPAQIDLYATPGGEYRFLFMAKGGGSANKVFLYQQTKAVLNVEAMAAFLNENLKSLGTSACPPYHLAVVVGGTSAEANLKTVKLASAHWLDTLPTSGGEHGQAFRDLEMEAKVLQMTRDFGIGAQFGGKYYCHDVRVIRLPRHGASCPVGIGVSCSADRQVWGKITPDGVFLEKLETDPARFMPDVKTDKLSGEAVRVDLSRPMDEIRKTLSQYPVKTRVLLSGPMIVARDIAHARLKARLDAGEPLPDYFRDHAVYYAGPAKTPEGYPSGAFGPTTAGRMDAYVEPFQAAGGSMVMLAKGNRSPQVREACQKHGGFYLGTIGGAAAEVAQESIRKVEVLAFPELGMEAVWKIEVEDFPAFIITDDKGNDFFQMI